MSSELQLADDYAEALKAIEAPSRQTHPTAQTPLLAPPINKPTQSGKHPLKEANKWPKKSQ